MTREQQAQELDDRISALVRRGADAPFDEAAFGRLALDLHAHQTRFCPPLAALVSSGGAPPAGWRQIPQTPSSAFKSLRIAAFPVTRAAATYRTSGTTGAERGVHELETVALYREASLEAFRAALLPDRARLPAVVLAATPAEAPDSSLSAMLGFVVEELAAPGGGFFMRRGELDDRGALLLLRRHCEAGQPVMVLGTSFAFVHLCDRMAARGETLALAAGSRVMETGGYKGRSRVVPRPELVALIEAQLGVPATHVVNEYGMTELSSQLYTDSLMRCVRGLPPEPAPRWWSPPWLRARALDPDTLLDVEPGAVGVLALVDVVNRGSSVTLLTADLGAVHPDGRVEVQGRSRAVDDRGCSLSFDAALASAAAPVAAWELPGDVAAPAPAPVTSTAGEPPGAVAAPAPVTSTAGEPPGAVAAPAPAPATAGEPPAAVAAACQRLVAARGALAGRSISDIARALGRVSARWLEPGSPLREEALRTLPETTGLSSAVLAAGLDRSFAALTADALLALAHAELGPHAEQDRWVPHAGMRTRALGPSLVLIVGAGNVPVPLAVDVFAALLLRAAVLVKPPSDEPRFARLLARSIAEEDAALGACVEVVGWPGGSLAHEAQALAVADAVVATGDDSSVLSLRARAPLATRFVARGSRLSVGLLACESLRPSTIADLARRVALDTLLWDQRGCLSPVAWLVEARGEIAPRGVAEAVALALVEQGLALPASADRERRVVAAFARARADVRRIAGDPVLRVGDVLLDDGPLAPQAGRLVTFKPLCDLATAPVLLAPFAGRLSNVLLEAPPHRTEALVEALLPLRPTRLCPVGRAQEPPAAWHHDGEPVLLPLVRWIDREL